MRLWAAIGALALWAVAALPLRAEYALDDYSTEEIVEQIVRLHMMRFDAPERREMADLDVFAALAAEMGMEEQSYRDLIERTLDKAAGNMKPRDAAHFLARGAQGHSGVRPWALLPIYMKAYHRSEARELEMCVLTLVYGAKGVWRQAELVEAADAREILVELIVGVYPDLADLPFDLEPDCSPGLS